MLEVGVVSTQRAIRQPCPHLGDDLAEGGNIRAGGDEICGRDTHLGQQHSRGSDRLGVRRRLSRCRHRRTASRTRRLAAHNSSSEASTVAAILQNPRYTGYAVFGRWTKQEELLDPDDAAAGNVIRFRRSPNHRIVRSKKPAHPAIVSVQTFTEAQLLRKRRAGTGNRARGRLERTRQNSPRDYLLRGLVRCDACGRKMQAAVVRGVIYYRCRAKTLAPGSPALAEHPPTVNLREDLISSSVDRWLTTLFDRTHRDHTITSLLAAQDNDDYDTQRALLRRRIADADARLGRHLAAIEAGVDPQALVSAMNAAQADKAATQAELQSLPNIPRLSETEIRKLIDSLGDIAAVLAAGARADKANLYRPYSYT
ncbi:recombinase family protein [Nocardia sp. NPDC052278]|uniref:recombinase family protein n=1 Tax=unclassified Nocardia TaxID=2637762 RepID=UPI0036B80770